MRRSGFQTPMRELQTTRQRAAQPPRPAPATYQRSLILLGRGEAIGFSDDDDGEPVGVEKAARHPTHVGQCHRLDKSVAAVQVVDAEALELHGDEDAGDAAA